MEPLLSDINESSEPHKYNRKAGLIRRKLAYYIPVMIATNLSLLLINTVDQLVAGNYIGKQAMSSISIFYPLSLVISVFSGPVASGIATAIANAQGKNDIHGLKHARSAGKRIMITIAAAISIIQIPIVFLLISTFNLSPEVSQMAKAYSIGMMICTPFGIFSTVGTYVLQTSGKMKTLMMLSITEGVSNVAFDLLFVAVMDMGVAGAGYGTACANIIRATLTIICMVKTTDFFKGDGKPVTLKDYRDILSLGLPDAAFMLMVAFQNYVILRIVIHAFGDDGGVVFGLCSFCLSVVNVLLISIQGSMRPLMGLYMGGGDLQAIRALMRNGAVNVLISAGLFTAAIIYSPTFFYHLHGIKEIPDGGLLSVQLYSLCFVLRGFNQILRLYFTNKQDIRFATSLTVLGNATLPLFALIMYNLNIPHTYIFLSYMFTELLILGPSILRYKHLRKQDRQNSNEDLVLYMTVEKGEAIEASKYIRTFADKHGIDSKVSFRVALCMEEMVAFIEESDFYARIPRKHLYVDIVIRFIDKNSAIFTTLDDGAFLDLDSNKEVYDLVTDNYELIRKLTKSVQYQYVLNLNYTIITI